MSISLRRTKIIIADSIRIIEKMRSKAVELEISCFFVILCITDFDFEDEGVVVLEDLSEDFAETELLMTDDLVIEDVAEVILTVVVLVSDDVVAG